MGANKQRRQPMDQGRFQIARRDEKCFDLRRLWRRCAPLRCQQSGAIDPREFSDGSSETFSLEDKMKLQRFELRHPVVTYSAKVEILAVYRGERHDEMAISEIAFNRD